MRVSGYDHGVMRTSSRARKISYALGWFSIGLGIAELVAPDGVARLIGAPPGRKTRIVTRAFGLRELAAGIGILTRSRPTGWMWSRVAGDAIDLTALGNVMKSKKSHRNRTLVAAAAVAGITALDVLCGKQLSDGRLH